MPLESLAKEALGGCEIAPFAEPELDCITIAVDGAVKVRPSPADFDVCLIDMPLASDRPLA